MRLSIGVGKCGERFDEIGLRPRLPSQSSTVVSLMKSSSKDFISINTLHNTLNAKLPIHNPNVKFSMKSWHSISFSKKKTPALRTLNPQKSTRGHLAPKTLEKVQNHTSMLKHFRKSFKISQWQSQNFNSGGARFIIILYILYNFN